MHLSGYQYWSPVHGFYADMGGFVLKSRDYVEFPISGQQLHYLVSQGYMQAPTISEKEIWDKSKADRFAKIVAFSQIGWLVAQVVARWIQRLPITLLELSTVALITCTCATLFFWYYKPLSAGTPTLISISCPLAQILKDAGDRAQIPFKDTPLDFIEPNIYTSSQLPFSHIWSVQERPLPRLPNDRDSHLHNLTVVFLLALPTAAFSLLHLAAWNFEFPSTVEKDLWRWTCVSMSIVLAGGCFLETGSIIASGYTKTGLTNLNGYKLRWPQNLLFIVPGFMYTSARLVVIVEIIVSLRLLPPGCFKNVQWTELLPHF